MKKIYLLLVFLFNLEAKSQLYVHDFGATTISAHPYTIAPTIFQTGLSGSSWSNSTSSFTSYTGSTGEAIAISNSGGTPVITLTFNIAAGNKLNISSFNFWRQRSTTGAQNWTMTINGIAVGSGTSPETGASIGTTVVSNPVNNLTGTVSVVLSLSGASGSGTFRLDDFTLYGTVVPDQFVLLDHFNRNDSIRPAIPSSGGPAWWVEQESGFCFLPGSGSALEKIRIKNNLLELSSCTYSNSTCSVSQTQSTSMNMTGKYPTIFSTASGTMEWYFNMQQSRADPSGFGSGQYGAAFVIGSITNIPTDNPKSGYAIIFGEAGTADPLRLVSFNGFAFNSTTFTNILSVPSPAVKTNYMSIKVTFNPCTSEWTLTARDDGALTFADPSTVTGVGATAVNTTFTSANLLWLGQVWNHASSGCTLAKFDNIYIPKVGASTGTYTWNGSMGTDFQSPYNWTPVRQCVNVTDKLVFNSSSPASSVITNVPVQSIAQLTVTNNRTLTLHDIAGDGIVSTLTIAGSAGTDLQVDAGSSLILDVATSSAGDAMLISLGAGATASISGTISFKSTPGGTRPHRLLANDANAITVNSGGIIKAIDLTGNPFGSTLPQHTVVFNTGSVYECYSGANPFALAQPASKVLFNNGSTYRHFSANPPSVLGRSYADFESNTSFDVSTGGAAVFTVNSFKILSGTVQFTGSINSQPVNTDIKGDLILMPGTGFRYEPVAASTFQFNGTTVAQKINSTGTLVFGRNLTVKLNSSYATSPQLTVETNISVSGVLDIAQGTLKLTGNITLVSDSFATASVAPITGLINYGTGRFIVERYIPAHPKAWQFLAVPATGQTVNAAWQEGNAPLVAGTPGLGTIITSNIAGTGFDVIGGGGPSMKTYDTSGAGSWKGITRTDTALYNKKGYMLFVRGDRTVTFIATPANETKLRSTGLLFDPASNIPPVTSVGSGKFESIGNPYASAIDFSNDLAVIKSANMQRVFYVWDPKLGTGYGGYQAFVKGAGTDYTVLPGGGSYPLAGSVHNLVQSGQAFFVRAVGGTGTIQFTENAKVNGSSLVTRPGNGNGQRNRRLRTSLYSLQGTGSILSDGVMNEFDPSFSGSIDILDVHKLTNVNESISLVAGNVKLSAERRGNLLPRDTIFFKLENLRLQEYELEFVSENITGQGVRAFLVDRYLQQRTQVQLSGTIRIRFSVTDNPGSYAADRFMLVFQKGQAKRIPENPKLAGEIFVYPNPVTDSRIFLSFSNMPSGKYSIKLINQSAQVLQQSGITVTGYKYNQSIPIKGILPGNYKLVITGSTGYTSIKHIIVK